MPKTLVISSHSYSFLSGQLWYGVYRIHFSSWGDFECQSCMVWRTVQSHQPQQLREEERVGSESHRGDSVATPITFIQCWLLLATPILKKHSSSSHVCLRQWSSVHLVFFSFRLVVLWDVFTWFQMSSWMVWRTIQSHQPLQLGEEERVRSESHRGDCIVAVNYSLPSFCSSFLFLLQRPAGNTDLEW